MRVGQYYLKVTKLLCQSDELQEVTNMEGSRRNTQMIYDASWAAHDWDFIYILARGVRLLNNYDWNVNKL